MGSIFFILGDYDMMLFLIYEFSNFSSIFLADVGIDFHIETFLFTGEFFIYRVSSFLVLRIKFQCGCCCFMAAFDNILLLYLLGLMFFFHF